MTTIIFMPQSSTHTHKVTAITVAGRTMKIEVEANNDISSEAVLRDVADSLHPNADAKLDLKVSLIEVYLWTALAVFLGWAMAGLVGFGIYMLGVMSDFFPAYQQPRFSDIWPLIGGFEIGKGLFRLYVVLLPIMLVMLLGIAIWDGVKGRDNHEGRKS